MYVDNWPTFTMRLFACVDDDVDGLTRKVLPTMMTMMMPMTVMMMMMIMMMMMKMMMMTTPRHCPINWINLFKAQKEGFVRVILLI